MRKRTIAGQFSRALGIWLGLLWSLASCGGGAPTSEGADGTSFQLPSASPSPTAVTSLPAKATPTASPRPEFSSTTEPASAAPVDAIAVEMAGPPPHYLPKDLVTQSGDIVFFVKNTSLGNHNIAIGRGPLKFTSDRVTNLPVALSGVVLTGHKATFSVDQLPSGAYVFWCTISDHAAEGMNGTLTVSP
jgi:plastocyanin